MKIFKWVEQVLFILSTIIVFASCQDVVEQNNTKIVGLEDPSVDGTVKSALENGSVSEVVVRKDLLLFPVNAPNLVIAHRQEIHAIPQNDSINQVNGKPTAAEVAEVNEYSLSQLVSTNNTNNESESDPSIPVAKSTFSSDPQNDPVLEPGKLLEIVSGFNLSKGLSTETVPLPNEVQNINLPKQSIIDILSKPLTQQNLTMTTTVAPINYYYGKNKRSAELYENEENESTTSTTTTLPSYTGIIDLFKRSADSNEKDESDDSNSNEKDESNSDSNESTTLSVAADVFKRSIDSDEDDYSSNSDSQESQTIDSASAESDDDDNVTADDTSDYSTKDVAKRSINSIEDMNEQTSTSSGTSVSTTEKITEKSINSIEDMRSDAVKHSFQKLVTNSTTRGVEARKAESSEEYEALKEVNNEKSEFKGAEEEDMDVAEDIVFRPLFRYRQETRYRQEEAQRRSSYRIPSYNGNINRNRYRYSDYD